VSTYFNLSNAPPLKSKNDPVELVASMKSSGDFRGRPVSRDLQSPTLIFLT
jgi:hypothetical protein